MKIPILTNQFFLGMIYALHSMRGVQKIKV